MSCQVHSQVFKGLNDVSFIQVLKSLNGRDDHRRTNNRNYIRKKTPTKDAHKIREHLNFEISSIVVSYVREDQSNHGTKST